jgi:hypothetical protein
LISAELSGPARSRARFLELAWESVGAKLPAGAAEVKYQASRSLSGAREVTTVSRALLRARKPA